MTTHSTPAKTATTRAVDIHALPAMLTALRLPSVHRHWPALAERADKEGWPAARFLAALAEVEIAERETRRIRRHLIEARLPGGKTLATFDFKALPSVPRARVEALAAGDWIETGANLIAIGNSGAGKTHLLCAVGHALVEAGRRVLYSPAPGFLETPQTAYLSRDGGALMDDVERGGAAGAETSNIGAAAAPGRERRMTAGRKREAVLRLLRGEPLEIVARELAVTAAALSGWREAFLDGGSAGLKSRARDARDETIDRLRTKVGELTMDTELLQAKIERLEGGGGPFAARRSKR